MEYFAKIKLIDFNMVPTQLMIFYGFRVLTSISHLTSKGGPSTISSVNLDSCVDEEGQERRVGEEWSPPGESCLVYHCERGGFVFSFNKCPPSLLRSMLGM